MDVHPSVLEWAIERSGKSRDDIERKFPKCLDWVAQTIRPTYRQLELFARATYTPFGFFFLPEPPGDDLPIPLYRSSQTDQGHRPSVHLLDTVSAMKRRQDWMREHLIRDGCRPHPLVRSENLDGDSVAVADRLRDFLGLSRTWNTDARDRRSALRVLRDAVDEAGILVFFNGIVGNDTRRPLDVNEFRGFVLIDDYAPLVFVNGADALVGRLFTLAHELAHVAFGVAAAFDLRDMRPSSQPEELKCNAVAAELLVPEARLRRDWSPHASRSDLIESLSRKYKVSRLVIAYRAMDMALLTFDEFGELRSGLAKPAAEPRRRPTPGGDFWRNQYWRVGPRFAAAVHSAARAEELLFRDAYDLTDCRGATFDSLVTELVEGGVGER